MAYTFSQYISALATAKAFPADLDAAGRKAMFNEALELPFLYGPFNGTEDELTIRVNNSGEVTLPRHWLTIKGVKVDGVVRNLASPWYNYLQGTSDSTQWSCNVIDQGDGNVTYAQPTGLVTDGDGVTSTQSVPAKLRFACADSPTVTCEVHGLDADGMEVYNGSQRGTILTANAGKAAPYFNYVREIIMPVTTNLKYLYACYDDSTEEVIGVYEPGETVPRLRRYLVGDLITTDEDDLSDHVIQVRALKRFVAMSADTDVPAIQVFGAMKNYVLAIHWQNEGDEDRQTFHLEKANEMLNKELLRLRPKSEIGMMRVNAFHTAGTNLRMMR